MAAKVSVCLMVILGCIQQITIAKSRRSSRGGDDKNGSLFPPPLVRDYKPGDTCYAFTHGNWKRKTFASPNYPGIYSNKTECIALLVAPKDHTLVLDWRDTFAIEENEVCEFDFLEVRDGPYGYSQLIGRFCGFKFPDKILSKTRYLWLRFVSDESVEWKGFRAVYSFKLNPDPEWQYSYNFSVCLLNVIDAATSDDLTKFDGKFDNSIPQRIKYQTSNYERPLDCAWELHIPRGFRMHMTFPKFFMKTKNCVESFVEVYDSTTAEANMVKRYCNSKAAKAGYLSVSNRLIIRVRAATLSDAAIFSAFYSILYTGPCPEDGPLFPCGDNTCVKKDMVCNGVINCATSQDEMRCGDRSISPNTNVAKDSSKSPQNHLEMTDYHTIILGVIGGLLFIFIIICICITCFQRKQEVSSKKSEKLRSRHDNISTNRSSMTTELRTLLARPRTPPFDNMDARHVGNHIQQSMQFTDIYSEPSVFSQFSYSDLPPNGSTRPYTPSLDRQSAATVSIGIQTHDRTLSDFRLQPTPARTTESIPGELDRFYSTPLCGEFAKRHSSSTPSSCRKFPIKATIETTRSVTPQESRRSSNASQSERSKQKFKRSNSLKERIPRTPSPPDLVQMGRVSSPPVKLYINEFKPRKHPCTERSKSRSRSRLDPSIFNEHSSVV